MLLIADGLPLEVARIAGALVMFGGIGLLVAAQLDLGASWRIGVDYNVRHGLVTTGLYRWCRNPIYLALLLISAGYALALPTNLSLALAIGMYVGIRQQIAAEEDYLDRAYGEPYRDYARRVGRLLPGFGKRRS